MVFVDVTAYNSKNYYIQGEVLVPGKLPVTGRETILDAINYAGGMTCPGGPQGCRSLSPAIEGWAARGFAHRHRSDHDGGRPFDELPALARRSPGRSSQSRMSKPEATESKAEHPQRGCRAASSRLLSTSIVRRRDSDTPTASPLRGATKPLDNGPSLRRVEARLNDLERKLDMIIEMLQGEQALS